MKLAGFGPSAPAQRAGDSARPEPGETPLHRAAGEDADPTVIQALFAAGAEVDARDRFGWTPLHRATHNLNRTVVPTLAAFGADLEARNAEGSTPLHLAAEQFRLRGDPVTVEALLSAGADPSTRDAAGATPADCAEDRRVLRMLTAASRMGSRRRPPRSRPARR